MDEEAVAELRKSAVRFVTLSRQSHAPEGWKRVKEHDIFVPLYFTDGTPVEAEKFQQLQDVLLDHSGGLTFFPQLVTARYNILWDASTAEGNQWRLKCVMPQVIEGKWEDLAGR